eukprot:scaffold41882_cov191-Amphora_coffeaeformis.AAC.1
MLLTELALALALIFPLAEGTGFSLATLGALTDYHLVFLKGSTDGNWQGASKGFSGDVAVNGKICKERTSGTVPHQGNIVTNDANLGNWGAIVTQNNGHSVGVYDQADIITGLQSDFDASLASICDLPATHTNWSPTNLNTANGVNEVIVIDVKSGTSVSTKYYIEGDEGDLFVFRWGFLKNADGSCSYKGQVKFQSGGGLFPKLPLSASHIINVAGDINASGGGSNPDASLTGLPQCPTANNVCIPRSSSFSGGGFFVGYWLTLGDSSKQETSSLSNAIFLGGWYNSTKKFSLTSGTSGSYIPPAFPPPTTTLPTTTTTMSSTLPSTTSTTTATTTTSMTTTMSSTLPSTTSTTTATTTTPATTTMSSTLPSTTATTTTTPCNVPSTCGGDPHFARWGQEHDSFHGECDLVLIHSKEFHNGVGLDLYVRTTIQDYFSYIETAALRVGDNVVELYSNRFFLNGVELTPSDLPVTFGNEYKTTISNGPLEEGKNARFYQYYKVDLHVDSSIVFKFYKQYLTMSISGNPNDFADAVGLLGRFPDGDMISRDGDMMNDFTSFGFVWQVSPGDKTLFREERAPQLPFEMCRMPTNSRPARRRLRANNAVFDEASKACAHIPGKGFDLCVED